MHLQVDAEVGVSRANQKNDEFAKVLNSNYDVQEKESVDVQNPIISRMSQESYCSSEEEVKEQKIKICCCKNRIKIARKRRTKRG